MLIHPLLKNNQMIKRLLRLKWGWILLTVLWFYFVSVGLAGSAQNQPPLALTKTASPGIAVTGDRLTYALTLTNTSSSPLTGITVTDVTPAGTTLFGLSGPPGWIMTSPGPNLTGSSAWRADHPLAPGEVVTLQLIVNILHDAPPRIVNDLYEARAEGWPEAVRGPAVVTLLATPTPTWTPPPRPVAAATATPLPTQTPRPTPTVTASVVIISTPTPLPTATTGPDTTFIPAQPVTGSNLTAWVSGLAGFIIILVVIFGVARRKKG